VFTTLSQPVNELVSFFRCQIMESQDQVTLKKNKFKDKLIIYLLVVRKSLKNVKTTEKVKQQAQRETHAYNLYIYINIEVCIYIYMNLKCIYIKLNISKLLQAVSETVDS